MARNLLLALVIAAGVVGVWMAASSHFSALVSSQDGPFPYKDYHVSEGEPLNLALGSMSSLPDGTVFLGGSYRTPAAPLHTCMLVSRDNGKTWTDSQLNFPGSTIQPIVTHGEKMVWALVLYNVEGVQSPEYLLRSENAGMSWETIPWKWSPEGPLTEVSDFRFFDEKHGLVWINNSLGKGEVYETSDSGRSWRSLWKTSYGEAPPFWQSDDPSKAVPGSGFWPEVPHVTEAGAEGYFTLRIQSIWRDAAGKDVPSQEFDNRCPNLDCASVYIVERLNSNERRSEDDEKPEVWRKVGEIPGEYALRGGALKPLEVRRK